MSASHRDLSHRDLQLPGAVREALSRWREMYSKRMGLLKTVFVNCHCVERLNARDTGGTTRPNHKRLHLTDLTACAEEGERAGDQHWKMNRRSLHGWCPLSRAVG